MIVLGLLSFATWWLAQVSLWQWVHTASQPLQSICVAQFESKVMQSIGSAMVCGQDLPAGDLRTLFLQLGIYHVLVVSGAHLIFLSQAFEAWQHNRPERAKLVAGLLLAFALMTGFQAPIVRAGLQILFRRLRRRHPLQHLFISYIACLVLHPPWLMSVSLHLSLLAAIGMSLPLSYGLRSLAIIILTLPLILGFGTFNLPGAMMGIGLSPVIELLLFPMCLLAWILPLLQPLIESAIVFALQLLESLRPLTGAPISSPNGIVAPWIPIYTMSVMGILQKLGRLPC